MSQSEKEDIQGNKEVAFYSALVNAWISTRMEKDKQILTLSAAGIGLVVLFKPELKNLFEFLVWFASGFSFLGSIFLLLSVFTQNSNLIKAEIKEPKSELKKIIDRQVASKTKWSGWLFLMGALLSFLLAISQTNFIQINMIKEAVHCE